jgi:hypothetical protein
LGEDNYTPSVRVREAEGREKGSDFDVKVKNIRGPP